MLPPHPTPVIQSFVGSRINSLPDDKNVDLSKLKVFADDKLNVTQKAKICFGKDRKYCGKSRKSCLPAFSPYPTIFSTDFFLMVIKNHDCVLKG